MLLDSLRNAFDDAEADWAEMYSSVGHPETGH